MPAAVRDRVLRALVGLLVIETAASMAVSLLVSEPRNATGAFHNARGWLALLWLVLLVAVSWRSARYVLRLRGLLGQRDAQLAAVAATSHDWLWEATPDLVATYCSPAIGPMLGRLPEQVLGRSFLELICDEDVPLVRQLIERARQDGSGWDDVEMRWKHVDGHALALQCSAVPVHDKHGTLLGFRGTRRLAPRGTQDRRRHAERHRVAELLSAGTVAIALQPIVTLDRGVWVGVEALARFPDGRTPDVWFREATQAGLGPDLELLTVRLALAAFARLPDRVFLSINASPALILDPLLRQCLTDAEVPLDRVVIEITEHTAIAGYREIATALAPLRERGLRLAVDDAGAGYASFSHVLRLKPDIVKLDRSLISGIDTDPARRAFVTAIVVLGRELNATLTGEGVETAEELAALAALGVDDVQGYLLARPTVDPACWETWKSRAWPAAT